MTYTEKIKDIESEVDKPTTTTTKKKSKKIKMKSKYWFIFDP